MESGEFLKSGSGESRNAKWGRTKQLTAGGRGRERGYLTMGALIRAAHALDSRVEIKLVWRKGTMAGAATNVVDRGRLGAYCQRTLAGAAGESPIFEVTH
jgi:hypothetical protein